MLVVRRVYVYLLSFAGLWTLAGACVNLANAIFRTLLDTVPNRDPAYLRQEVALWGATALVGLPVWLAHWRWAQHAARAPEERRSALRRLFVYGTLAVAAVLAASGLHDVLDGLLVTTPASLKNAVEALPRLLVASVVWLLHWRHARADRAAVGERGFSATLRRWYLSGATLVGLLVMLIGTQQLANALWHAAARSQVEPLLLTSLAPTVLVSLAVWLLHATFLAAQSPEDDPRAILPTVFQFLGLAVFVTATVGGISQLLYYALGRALGLERPGGVSGNLLEAAAGPATTALVFGIGWAYQQMILRRAERSEAIPVRVVGIRRLYTHLVALLSLAALAAGVAGLLWSLADAATTSAASRPPEWLLDQVARFATLTLVGLPLWLVHWRRRPPAGQEHSLARRLYLYLALIAAMLALLGSAARVGYRLLSLALGAPAGVDLAADLGHALAVTVVAAGLAVYHWLLLRSDGHRSDHPPAPLDPDVTYQERLLRLRSSDPAALDWAVRTLRGSGLQVDVVEGME